MVMLIINVILLIVVIKYIFYLVVLFTIKKYIKYTVIKKKNKVTVDKSDLMDLTSNSQKTNKSMKKRIADILYGSIKFSLSKVGKIPSSRIRVGLLKNIYQMQLGKNVVIYNGFDIRDPYNIRINDGTIIGDNCVLDGRKGISIGKNVNLSTGVWIWTEQHDYQCPYFGCNNKGGKVEIKDHVWVSCRVIILPGVTIGEGAVIAAGAVVTKNVEPFSVYAGIPAKKIGNRNENLKYVFNGDYLPFC